MELEESVVAALRKVQKIGKGLKSNGNSNKLERSRSYEGLLAFLCLHFTPVTLSGSLHSGVLCENHSVIFVI